MQELSRIVKNKPKLEIYEKSIKSDGNENIKGPVQTLSWRDHARELIELRYQNYIFDTDKDWHSRIKSWIGVDSKTKLPIALLCILDLPSEKELLEFTNYVEDLFPNNQNKIEYLIVTQHQSNAALYKIGEIEIPAFNEEQLLDNLVDFSDYIIDIKRRVERETLPDSKLKIKDIYVKSCIKNSKDEILEEDLEGYLSSWVNESGQRQLTLLGEYGQGKSTGTLLFTYNILMGENPTVTKIPLYIELRGKSPSSQHPLQILGSWASSYRIHPLALMKLIQSGRVFLIFEGFDEMANVADLESRKNHLRNLWKFSFPKAKILFTGRPNFFLGDEEFRNSLGISSPTGTGPYCDYIHLFPFDKQKIEQSLRYAEKSVREEIVSLSEINPTFLDIVSRPSLLYIVAHMWNLPEFAKKRESVDSAIVMDTFIESCFRRQTEKHDGEIPEFMILTEQERKYFMDGLTVFIATNSNKNQINTIEFENIIKQLFSVIPDVLPTSSVLSDVTKEPLKVRMQFREDALEAIITDVRTCGLLVRDYSKPNTLKYPHKSFMGFLFAKFIALDLLGENRSYYLSIKEITNYNLNTIIDSEEILSFISEIITGKLFNYDKIKIVKELFNKIIFKELLYLPEWVKVNQIRMIVTLCANISETRS